MAGQQQLRRVIKNLFPRRVTSKISNPLRKAKCNIYILISMNTFVPDKLGFLVCALWRGKAVGLEEAGLQPWEAAWAALSVWHCWRGTVTSLCTGTAGSVTLQHYWTRGDRKAAWPQNLAVQGHQTLSWAGNHTCTCKKGAPASPGYKQRKWGSQGGLMWGWQWSLIYRSKEPLFHCFSHLSLQVNWDKWRGWLDPSSTVCSLATKAILPFPLYRGPGPALPLWSDCS